MIIQTTLVFKGAIEKVNTHALKIKGQYLIGDHRIEFKRLTDFIQTTKLISQLALTEDRVFRLDYNPFFSLFSTELDTQLALLLRYTHCRRVGCYLLTRTKLHISFKRIERRSC